MGAHEIHQRLDVARTLSLIESWLHQLESGDFAINPLAAGNAPQLRLLPDATLLIATRNIHKAGEIRAILSKRFDYLTLRDFPAADGVGSCAVDTHHS